MLPSRFMNTCTCIYMCIILLNSLWRDTELSSNNLLSLGQFWTTVTHSLPHGDFLQKMSGSISWVWGKRPYQKWNWLIQKFLRDFFYQINTQRHQRKVPVISNPPLQSWSRVTTVVVYNPYTHQSYMLGGV